MKIRMYKQTQRIQLALLAVGVIKKTRPNRHMIILLVSPP